MEIAIKKISMFVLLSLFFAGCSTTKRPRRVATTVPIAIHIITDQSVDFTNLNTDLYKFRVKDFLDDFRDVNLELTDFDEEASVILSIGIENFNIFPKEERISRRAFRRNVQTGTGPAGQPIIQTVTATVDIVQTRIRSSALLSSRFVFKDRSYSVPPYTSFANYIYENVTVENIQGDPRAIDASIYVGRSIAPIEPFAEEFLMGLSNRELLRRISFDLRKYYQKLNNSH